MYADFPGIQQPNSNLRSKHQLAALYRYLQQENQNDATETLLGQEPRCIVQLHNTHLSPCDQLSSY